MNLRCQSRSLSSLSLWLSLYCVLALLFVGIENTFLNIQHLWIIFFLITVCFIVAGWSIGERERSFKYFDLTKLRHCIIYFFCSLFVSLVLFFGDIYIYYFSFIDVAWDFLLIISVLIPFANFVAFFVISKNKFKGLKKEIDKKAIELKGKCDIHKSSVDDLLTASRLSVNLSEERISSNSQK